MRLTLLLFILLAPTAHALAEAKIPPAETPIEQLLRGKGKPGQTLRSRDNGDIVYRVLDGGLVEKRNEKYGTRTYLPRRVEDKLEHRLTGW
ncbi:MAG: hypothetical protein ACRECY_10395 [Phyllobacterium sp.]